MQVGLFDEKFGMGEDYLLYLLIARRHSLALNRHWVVERRVHPANVSAKLEEMLAGTASFGRRLIVTDFHSASDAARAEEWGLIWKTVDDTVLMGEALHRGQSIRRGPMNGPIMRPGFVLQPAWRGLGQLMLALKNDGSMNDLIRFYVRNLLGAR